MSRESNTNLPARVQEFVTVMRRQNQLSPQLQALVNGDASLWDHLLAKVTHSRLLKVIEDVEIASLEDQIEITRQLNALLREVACDELRSHAAAHLARMNVYNAEEVAQDIAACVSKIQDELADACDQKTRDTVTRLKAIRQIDDSELRDERLKQLYRETSTYYKFTQNLFQKAERLIDAIFEKYRPRAHGDVS